MFWQIMFNSSKQALLFMCLQYKSFEIAVDKGEIVHNSKFFTSVFFPFENFVIFIKFEIFVCKLVNIGRV